MAGDGYGIIISTPGVSVSNAKPNQILLNTNNPMLKIDTQNKVGFQTVTLLLTTALANPPSSGGSTYTTVYQYAHGYSYVPTVEMLCFVQNPPANDAGNAQTYFQDRGYIGGPDPAQSYGLFYVLADATNVYYIVENVYGSRASVLGLPFTTFTGTNLVVSTHIFIEPTGT